ncbi:hypothetical protein [Rhizobium mongolense]|uniref:Uncharacterized protein n=1 Tax=Rhizobium mongolense TaxID=57676 RepID=A0A7W6RRF4_9HYPH|nr:hypothetical protein [Rhizobium mongolense]MBB4277242.1 hypothetical protein [Rhizobium mongolense]
MTIVTRRTGGAINSTATKRVTGALTESTTKRVPAALLGLGPFLLLEGDYDGALILTEPDDVQAQEDNMELEGFMRLEGSQE